MLKKTIIFWRDIPSQVIVQKGRKREKALLSSRFQEAIDRAAMRAGKGSSNAYMEDWRRDSTRFESTDSIAEIARREAACFEDSISDEMLLRLIHNHGVEKKPCSE